MQNKKLLYFIDYQNVQMIYFLFHKILKNAGQVIKFDLNQRYLKYEMKNRVSAHWQSTFIGMNCKKTTANSSLKKKIYAFSKQLASTNSLEKFDEVIHL